MSLDLLVRPRRLRGSTALRALVCESRVETDALIYPLFVQEGEDDTPVGAMPGVLRRSLRSLLQECREVRALGLRAVAVFPCISPEKKDATGSAALDPEGLLPRTLRALKEAVPDLAVIADVALDPYTSHGHDGILDASGQDVANDATVDLLIQQALLEAEAGADVVAPSDMMDGRVGAIRRGLDAAGFSHVPILSYAAKFASAFYGPFREAVGSKTGHNALSKATYQLDPANTHEALRECRLDETEGADILMIKPAGPYLDVIRAVTEHTSLPVAAYQVSGEYAQIHAAARLGWLDYRRTRDESLLAIRRAGARMIFSYFAGEIARERARKT